MTPTHIAPSLTPFERQSLSHQLAAEAFIPMGRHHADFYGRRAKILKEHGCQPAYKEGVGIPEKDRNKLPFGTDGALPILAMTRTIGEFEKNRSLIHALEAEILNEIPTSFDGKEITLKFSDDNGPSDILKRACDVAQKTLESDEVPKNYHVALSYDVNLSAAHQARIFTVSHRIDGDDFWPHHIELSRAKL